MASHASGIATHDQNRSKICLMCWTKPNDKNRTRIQGINLTRIKSLFMTNYDTEDPYMPNALCSRCAKLLYNVEISKDPKKK